MSDFFLEIFNEEIPATMQKNAAENFARIATEILTKNGLIFDNSQLKTFVTPRRLTLYLLNLKATQDTAATTKIGPKINADRRAIEGFLRSVGLTSETQLEKVENNGHTCYAYVKAASQVQTADIIKNSLSQILQKMTTTWPKLMRWDVEAVESQPKWIRPIRNIACMFGNKIIDIEFAGLKSNNLTFGHYSKKASQGIMISNASDYREVLKDNFVLLDHEKRKQKIIEQIRKIKFDLGLETIDDEEKSPLFDEVAGLCEWPTALVASIDKKFLELPNEILVLTLKLNQKYFCLKNQEGNLAPQFIFISNALITSAESQNKIIQDNEKLVRARLNDAEFFVNEDLKKPLISRLNELKKIVFHQKLGSIFDKSTRLSNITKFLSIFIPHCDLPLGDRAADLCKADLTTKAVAELPELQGKIGSFYAFKQNEDQKIIAAIYEHYLPLGPNSELPQTPLGIALAISDKIDSIVGFFMAGEKPTSSKDPYALRRAALGIVRITFQYNIAFPIRVLIERSLNAYPAKMLKNLIVQNGGSFYENKRLLVEEIIKFFVERLKAYLKENNAASHDIINAVIEEYLSNLEIHKHFNILYLAKKIKFLDEFVHDSKNQKIIELYKRSANILAIEEKKDGQKYNGSPSLLSLGNKYERALHRNIKQISSDFKKRIIKGDFEGAFALLVVLETPLADFFDHVTVNDSDKNLRENRLLLLSRIRKLFNMVADLSKIEID